MRHVFLFFLQITIAFGHGQLDEQIAEVSAKIIANPNDPTLLLARADLHQSHRDPDAAQLDLQAATRLKPPHPPAFLKLTRFQRELGHLPMARETLKTYFTLTSAPAPFAHREEALLSSPSDSLPAWQLYLKTATTPSLHDYTLAAQAALHSKNHETSLKILLAGLNHHPKSIQLHQIHTQISLAKNDLKSAEATFTILKLLYPNLLVKLNYEESLIWSEHKHSDQSHQALLCALHAFNQLPPRLQKNRDLQELVAKIKTSLKK